MAKAHIKIKNGTTITIEGTPREVADLMERFKEGPLRLAKKRSADKDSKRTEKVTLGDMISELIDGGFFKKPKGLGEVKMVLEEQGHFYPVTTLSPILLRQVRRRELRRIKNKKRWAYVG